MKRQIIAAGALAIIAASGLYMLSSGKPPEELSGLVQTTSRTVYRLTIAAVVISVIGFGAIMSYISPTLEERQAMLQNATNIGLMGGTAASLATIAPYWLAVSGGSLCGALIAFSLSNQVNEIAAKWHEKSNQTG